MKIFFLSCLTAIVLTACTKSKQPVEDGGLAGTWILTERFTSPGSGGSWNPVPLAERCTIEFEEDGGFTYTANFPKADSLFTNYNVSNNEVRMSSLLNTKKDTWFYHSIDANELVISLFMCYEGCAYRFERK